MEQISLPSLYIGYAFPDGERSAGVPRTALVAEVFGKKAFFTTSLVPEKRFFTDSYCVGGTFQLYSPFSLKKLLFIVFNTAKEVMTPSAACKDRYYGIA
ncbi:MAG: hypothetical protein KIG68_05795 [Oxalobacter sp.]|nr:hypothetical protein [Oxalobacter sp.]